MNCLIWLTCQTPFFIGACNTILRTFEAKATCNSIVTIITNITNCKLVIMTIFTIRRTIETISDILFWPLFNRPFFWSIFVWFLFQLIIKLDLAAWILTVHSFIIKRLWLLTIKTIIKGAELVASTIDILLTIVVISRTSGRSRSKRFIFEIILFQLHKLYGRSIRIHTLFTIISEIFTLATHGHFTQKTPWHAISIITQLTCFRIANEILVCIFHTL